MTEITLKSGRGETKPNKKQNKTTKTKQNKKKRTKKREEHRYSLAQVETPKAEFIDTLEHFCLLKCSFKTTMQNPLIIKMLLKVMISIKGNKAEKKNSELRACYSAYFAEIIQNNLHFTG